MNIFSSLTLYAGKWSVKEYRNFTGKEIEAVDKAVVVASQYGSSVSFLMKSGGMTFIPLASDSSLGVGEEVDMTVAKLVTLEKQGESDILRVSI